ncbi:MAG: nucleoside 2-deoxyribosyltransferase [Phycisphaerales bacterium]|jgi:hypothetical protein
MKVYLCGPINGCTDAQCIDWREEAKKEFPDAIDPMRRDYRGKEAAWVQDLVHQDKRDVAACDVVLAYCPFPSVGTSMEVLLGWQLGKTVVAVVPDTERVSPWLCYHANVVASLEDAFAFIRQVKLRSEKSRSPKQSD